MARVRVRGAPSAVHQAESSLHLVGPSEHLAALQREQRRLLGNIARKKRSVERLKTTAQALADQVSASVRPLLEEHGRLCREIHGLFDGLLGAPDRPFVRNRGKIEMVYRTLIELGLIGDVEEMAEPDSPFDANGPSGARPPFETSGGGYSAPKDTAGHGHESLRSVFRRLAVKLHPDRVQDERDKLERTAAMKELTRAYESGDLARLLELERNYLHAASDPSTSNDAHRCAVLERTISELRKQLRALSQEAKVLKRSGPLAAVADFKRHPSEDAGTLVQELVLEAEEDLELLRELRGFVQAFREKKMSLDAFMAGPSVVTGRGAQNRASRRR
ncbi:MAG TPA: J domain-containing protein [Polyangiaceae bacterium]|jgi:hypothetical protein|nr:J domain-containing protein [Polyangiaceae bacterium]